MQSYIQLINNCKEVCFKDEQSGCTIGILAGYGAGLNRFEIPYKAGSFNLIKGYNKKADFEKLYNSVILAPFPNRIKDGQYTFEHKTYQLPINHKEEKHAMHGLLFDKAFIIETMHTENELAHLSLKYAYQGDVKGFPFPYECRVKYDWRPSENLTTTIEVKNTGDNIMPLGLGWHPYFMFPSAVNELALQLNCDGKYLVDERMIPTLESQNFDTFQQLRLLDDTVLDDCFAFKSDGSHKTIVKDEVNNITLIIEQETGKNLFNYLQLYTPKDRKSIAIEPMTCIPNAFNNGRGLIKLAANDKIAVSFRKFDTAKFAK